ncbi:MAG: hypothetical protein AMS26_03505 [Bacteroides sp. SM23_62]|nr:MAG: hypothetical protein AMS26_03505 [Bacteroides sp. SM23_62]
MHSMAIRSLILLCMLFSIAGVKGQEPDWRNIRNGLIIPDATYSDQPYIVKADDGAWLCILTTGTGREGQSGQYVAVTRSSDQGNSWSDLIPLEPPDGPEASYAVLLKIPSGRIYAFYNHNTDNIREIKLDDPDLSPAGTIRRVDSQGYFVFRYSDDHGKTWSSERYTIPVRAFEIDRINVYGGEIKFFWNVGKAFMLEGAGYVPLIKVGGFGEGFFTSNEGVLLRSPNILTEKDPGKLSWETLPDGDTGLRTPPGGGPISAEQSYSVMSDGSIYCVYRTIDGHPVYTCSRDGGYTWDTPSYLRFANGRLVKHPRAANFAWRCKNGKYLYWFHNHGGRFIREHPRRRTMAYQDRNPAWIMGGMEKDGPDGKIIEWTQPEILLYDDDPLIRMSYPDLVEDNGNYYVTETQKDIARVHEIDSGLLHGLWKQFGNTQKTVDGLMVNWQLGEEGFPLQKKGIRFDPFYDRDPGRDDHGGMHIRSGFTIDIAFRLDDLGPGQTLIDTRNESVKGLLLSTTDQNTVRFSMSDGRTTSAWDCDKGLLMEGKDHYISVIVDGGPKIIMFMVDGILNDGGDERQFGWGRFNPYLQDVNGRGKWTLGYNLRGEIPMITVYNRALRVSEAIGNYNFHINNK